MSTWVSLGHRDDHGDRTSSRYTGPTASSRTEDILLVYLLLASAWHQGSVRGWAVDCWSVQL